MNGLYPNPPHLTIAVYPGQPEKECFEALCGVAERLGCEPSGVLEVAPWEADFELRSDLVGRSSILEVKRDRFQRIVSGIEDVGRPVRAGYRSKGTGLVLVEYLPAPAGDRHPIAISVSAESLGSPVELWHKPERSSAVKLATWATNVLLEATAECNVLYGAIGVEYSLATPSELAHGRASLTSEVYVSRRLAEANPAISLALSGDFYDGKIAEWSSGWFYSSWGPFNSENVTLLAGQIRSTKAGIAIGRAASTI